MLNLWHKLTGRPPYTKEPALALPVVAIFRGTVDTFLDAIVILSAGVLVLVYLLFDILKPYPARKLETLDGGWGVMLDDFVAGLYAFLFTILLKYLW